MMPRFGQPERETVPTAESPQWTKSSFCAASSCVEVAKIDDQYLVRDSKNPQTAPLSFTPDEWVAFIRGVNAGEFGFN